MPMLNQQEISTLLTKIPENKLTSENKKEINSFLSLLPVLLQIYPNEISRVLEEYQNNRLDVIDGDGKYVKEDLLSLELWQLRDQNRHREFEISNFINGRDCLNFLNLGSECTDLEVESQIESRIQIGTIIAKKVRTGNGNIYMMPKWQFQGNNLIEGLEEVISACKANNQNISQASIIGFLTNSSLELNSQRPIDCLQKGEVERVVKVAKLIGENF
jgi:hypothetical protein